MKTLIFFYIYFFECLCCANKQESYINKNSINILTTMQKHMKDVKNKSNNISVKRKSPTSFPKGHSHRQPSTATTTNVVENSFNDDIAEQQQQQNSLSKKRKRKSIEFDEDVDFISNPKNDDTSTKTTTIKKKMMFMDRQPTTTHPTKQQNQNPLRKKYPGKVLTCEHRQLLLDRITEDCIGILLGVKSKLERKDPSSSKTSLRLINKHISDMIIRVFKNLSRIRPFKEYRSHKVFDDHQHHGKKSKSIFGSDNNLLITKSNQLLNFNQRGKYFSMLHMKLNDVLNRKQQQIILTDDPNCHISSFAFIFSVYRSTINEVLHLTEQSVKEKLSIKLS